MLRKLKLTFGETSYLHREERLPDEGLSNLRECLEMETITIIILRSALHDARKNSSYKMEEGDSNTTG